MPPSFVEVGGGWIRFRESSALAGSVVPPLLPARPNRYTAVRQIATATDTEGRVELRPNQEEETVWNQEEETV